MSRKMTYRELLELSRNHPNPFSAEGRKSRFYDYEVEHHEETKDKKKDKLCYKKKYKKKCK